MLNRTFLLLLIFTTLLSCEDDFVLEGEFEDSPSAYALLNADSDRHFVRVQKAFLEAGGNANTNAAIADSIYYGENDATVILRRGENGENVVLSRVDGAQFGLERDEGVFASSPNILYTVEASEIGLRGGDEVSLIIQRPGEVDAVATTTMLEPIEITRPIDEVRIDDYSQNLSIAFQRGNARAYEVQMVFNIRELNLSNPDLNRDIRLTWQVDREVIIDAMAGTSVTYRINNESIYRFIGNNLEPDDNLRRRFLDLEIQIIAAGEEIVERRTLANANTGITSSQVTPRYTNLDGGTGLVTSTTSTLLTGVTIDNSSRDSLRDGIYTRDLSF